MPQSPITIGLLYPGEMGQALVRVLISAGHRVVTCLDNRSPATIARSRSINIIELPSLENVVQESSLIISLVPPDAAAPLADKIAALAASAKPGSIYLDLNSISPDRKLDIARKLQTHHLDFVDGAINGLAANLTTTATLFLAGRRAHDVAHIIGQPPRVDILSTDPGDASAMKMLLSGFSKGICALYIELAALAEQRHLMPQLTDALARIYPDVESLAKRMIPTYSQHAQRRATEIHELLDTSTKAGLSPVVIRAIADLHDALAESQHRNRTSPSPAAPKIPLPLLLFSPRPVPRERARVRVLLSLPRMDTTMANKPQSASIHAGPGFRIRMNIPRPDPALCRALGEFATPDVSDLLNRLFAVDSDIHLMTAPHHRLCAPAVTVKVFPGDNLMVHKSLDVIEPGDVIIVDAGGSRHNAVLGDLISTKARHRGAAGFVVDGLVRDLPAIAELDFPVFARGASPIGPLHRGPGEINYAICCGGVVVNPGDIVIADPMGIVIVPRDIAPQLLERLTSHKDHNAIYLQSVRRGDFSNAWVDRILQDAQCQLVRGSDTTTTPQPTLSEQNPASLVQSIDLSEPSLTPWISDSIDANLASPVTQPAPAKPIL